MCFELNSVVGNWAEMNNLLKYKPFLVLLATCEPDQRPALLGKASPEQVHTCTKLYSAKKVMKSSYLTSEKSVACQRENRGRKKQILLQHGNGFLGL